ncbi:mechanosensitive ion channel family protein [Sulfurimonas lithotrophica]|uniref:Mechanosensitive ion channel family protein n=1 Tax=Sulfurimonas lithotrophica TaxID=2590022 RepID=A0A5P8P1Q7_9BACT|nr:mechanosensitive ion channel family protein [Sulfurimonas lithotrophica]
MDVNPFFSELLSKIRGINDYQLIQDINVVLNSFGLSVVKIILILFISLFLFILRKYFYSFVEKIFVKLNYTKKKSHEILLSLKSVFEYLLIFVNLEIIIYIYNGFKSIEFVSMFFNIIYIIMLTLAVYKVVNKIAAIKINTIDSSKSKIKASVINVGMKIVNFVILITGLLVILHSAGVNLTAVLSGLGIGGFAVALAAKDSLANFFGTLSILLSDTFRQGDWIVADGVEGTVVEIGLRVTIIRTFDNALISVPNANLANADIKNWNRRELGRRIKMSLGVKYDSKREDIKNAIEDIREMLINHPQIASQNTEINRSTKKEAKMISYEDAHGIKQTLLVYLDEFGASSINILVYCFSKTVNWAEWLEVKEDVMHKIMEIFEKNNLEFAFPSMSIYKEN